MPRIYLGMVAALARRAWSRSRIPQVLRCARRRPAERRRLERRSGGRSRIVLGLGVLEAVMIALRRWFVLTPGTHIEARMRNSLYAQLQDLPVTLPRPLAERPAAVARRQRPQPDPPLALVRPRAARRQHRHDRRSASSILFVLNWMLGLVFLVCSIPLWIYGYVFEKQVLRRSPGAARTRPATSRPPSRSRCTASGCSRRSAAASTR